MSHIIDQIAALNWQGVTVSLEEKGYALVPGFMTEKQCEQLINLYDDSNGYRKKVVMERYRFGLGEYKYFDYPLPDIIQLLRENLYPRLVETANSWMQQLKIEMKISAKSSGIAVGMSI